MILLSTCHSWIRVFSADFLSKLSKLFGGESWHQLGWFEHPAKLIENYKKMPLGGDKNEHFTCFHSSCQWGLKQQFARVLLDTNWGYFQLIFKLTLPDVNWKNPQIVSSEDHAKHCFKTKLTLVTKDGKSTSVCSLYGQLSQSQIADFPAFIPSKSFDL